jgi:hypothetical protein
MVLFSQQSQRLGNGLIRWRQDPDEPERFYVGCLWAIPFSVAMWAVIIWAGRPLAAFGRQHRIPPVTGRPVIFRSPPHPSTPPSKAAQYARLYMQRFGDPLARAIEIAAIPILADGVLAAFAKQIGARSRFEAFKAWASINASAMPFMVTAAETDEGCRWDQQRMTTLTGRDEITANFMRQDQFSYHPQFLLAFAGNHRPRIAADGGAMRRRMHLLPCRHRPKQIDKHLIDKLKAELGGS